MKYFLSLLLCATAYADTSSTTPPVVIESRPVNPHEMICVKVGQDLMRCANPETICYMRMDRDALSCFAR